MLADINGCRLYYEVRRNPSPDVPCVLLLHGWGCDHSIFAFIENELANSATVITLDFPGHGQSGEPSPPWGVGEYTEQVAALLEQLQLAPVQIISHSFGGRVALKLAATRPELVDKLVITGGAGIKKPETEKSRKRTAQYKRYSAFLKQMKAIPPLKPMVEKLQTKLRNRYGSADYVKLSEGMRKTFVKVISEDLQPLLSEVQASTLLIWGDNDSETPLWMGQTMEREIPDAGLVVFEGGSHYAFLEQIRRFLVIVKQFIVEDKT